MKSFIKYTVLAALSALLIGCSEKAELDEQFSLRKSSVSYAAGDMFVSIQTSGSWTISFEYAEGDE